MIYHDTISFESEGGFYTLNVTEQIRDILRTSKISNGIAVVMYQHTTGVVMIIEHEPGILLDLKHALEKIAPTNGEYIHHFRDVDFNGFAHIRNAVMSSSLTIPVIDDDLALGRYQEIIVLDMQPEPFLRKIVIQIMGE